MQAIIHAADIQDRDGGVLLMGALFGLYPFLLKLYADGGYQGAKFQRGLSETCGQVNLEIVKRSDLHKFVVCPNAGSSRGPSAGSIDADASPRTGNASAVTLSPFCVGFHPPHAQKTLSNLTMIPDGLSGRFSTYRSVRIFPATSQTFSSVRPTQFPPRQVAAIESEICY